MIFIIIVINKTAVSLVLTYSARHPAASSTDCDPNHLASNLLPSINYTYRAVSSTLGLTYTKCKMQH